MKRHNANIIFSCLVLLLGVCGCDNESSSISSRPSYTERVDPKDCNHNYLIENSIRFYDEEKTMKGQCEACKVEFVYNANIEYPAEGNYESTCTTSGLYTEVWTFDKYPDITHTIVKNLPLADHELGEVESYGTPATCTSSGTTDSGYCLKCNEFIESEFVDILGHDFVNTGRIEPTCITFGYEGTEVCDRCGYMPNDNVIIPKLRHKEVNDTFTARYNVKGYVGIGCSVCRTPISITKLLGEAEVDTYVEYQKDEQLGGLVITGTKKKIKDLVIPEHINGVQVVGIGNNAFKDNEILETITLPTNLTQIGDKAFYNCTSLEQINVPDLVQSIGESCFENCTQLKHVTLGRELNSIGQGAFFNCFRILEFKFPRRYTINFNVDIFDHRSNVTCLYLPEKYSSRNAYSICRNYSYVFKYNDENSYIVEEDGYYFVNINGVKELVFVDEQLIKNNILFVPKGTDVIGLNVLYKVRTVKGMVIPNSVYSIKNQHIYREPDDRNLNLDVYFEGTRDEWDFMWQGELTIDNQNTSNYNYYNTYYFQDENYGWDYDSNNMPKILDYYSY